jgi:hypothetical protein
MRWLYLLIGTGIDPFGTDNLVPVGKNKQHTPFPSSPEEGFLAKEGTEEEWTWIGFGKPYS